ncbi:MAG: spondin domain-containing protein [Myxococcota bacterium]
MPPRTFPGVALGAVFLSILAFAPRPVAADATRVVVTIENLAPEFGTSQTPFWVGFHEGVFDTYDGNTPASSNPRPGSVAMERLCEDGNNGPISEDFAALSTGVDATIPGPNGPIAPGDVATQTFLLESTSEDNRYFSYASMILPSNDFCISNGNPLAHPLFDDEGNFIASDFFVTGAETLDAGTEIGDEIPENTAFFGQSSPDTGVDENGLIGTLGSDRPAVGFLPKGSGGILDDPRFRMGDFLVPGYPFVKISFTAAPAVVEDLEFKSRLDGRGVVPSVRTSGRAIAIYTLREQGSLLRFKHFWLGLRDVIAVELRLGAEGENGPVIASLFAEDEGSDATTRSRRRFGVAGSLTSSGLEGPLTGQPLDALIGEIQKGNVHVVIRTRRAPEGEVRGQLDEL